MRTKDRLNELPKKYPELFKNSIEDGYGRIDKDTGEVTFYFQCGDGWYNLLDTLLHNIHHKLKRFREVVEIQHGFQERGEPIPDWIHSFFKEHKADPMELFSIFQIKEKFGGLRFYWGLEDSNYDVHNYIDGAVEYAESLSYVTCESCGSPGKREGIGWIVTLCDECRGEDKKNEDEG